MVWQCWLFVNLCGSKKKQATSGKTTKRIQKGLLIGLHRLKAPLKRVPPLQYGRDSSIPTLQQCKCTPKPRLHLRSTVQHSERSSWATQHHYQPCICPQRQCISPKDLPPSSSNCMPAGSNQTRSPCSLTSTNSHRSIPFVSFLRPFPPCF